jgi:hypothetical protein
LAQTLGESSNQITRPVAIQVEIQVMDLDQSANLKRKRKPTKKATPGSDATEKAPLAKLHLNSTAAQMAHLPSMTFSITMRSSLLKNFKTQTSAMSAAI